MAISPDSRPAGSEISLESLTLRSVAVDEPYRAMLERVRKHS